MSFYTKYILPVRDTFRGYWSSYRTYQFLRLYKKQKYEKIVKRLSTFDKYKKIKINEYHLMFFLISEENNGLIQQMMNVKYKQEMMEDMENPATITPAIFALINNLYDPLNLLKDNGANIFIPGKDGNGPLHYCSYYGNAQAAQYCLEKGCDINQQNNNGDTPVHIAVLKEQGEMVKFYLENKADLLIHNNNFYYPAHEAVEISNLEMLKLLEWTLPKVRNLKQKFDCVHLAAKLPNTEILQHLTIQNKALINIIDSNEYHAYPLHYASLGRSLECARYLLKNGALPNAQDKHGNTPMHIAVLNKDVNMCDLLQKHQADARIKNKDGLSCIDLTFSERDALLKNFFRSIPEYNHYFRLEE